MLRVTIDKKFSIKVYVLVPINNLVVSICTRNSDDIASKALLLCHKACFMANS